MTTGHHYYKQGSYRKNTGFELNTTLEEVTFPLYLKNITLPQDAAQIRHWFFQSYSTHK